MIRQVDNVNDLPEINGWLAEQNLPPMNPEHLPEFGIIEPGVAVLWIHRCEGHLWLGDLLATNPQRSSKVRHEALQAMAEMVLTCIPRGDRMMFYSRSPNIIARLQAMGCVPQEGQFTILSHTGQRKSE